MSPKEWLQKYSITIQSSTGKKTALELLKSKQITINTLKSMIPNTFEESIWRQIKIESEYETALLNNRREIEELQRDLNKKLDSNIDYHSDYFSFLSQEEKEKLVKVKPQTIAHAKQIGLTGSSLVLLLKYCQKTMKTINV